MNVAKRLDSSYRLAGFKHIFHPRPADNVYLAFENISRKPRHLGIIVGMIEQGTGYKKNQAGNVRIT